MADIGQQLIADLLASTDSRITACGSRVMQAAVPTEDTYPRVWIQRRSSVQELDLAGSGGLIQEAWDVECYAEATEANDQGLDTALNLAEAVKSRWHGKTGTIGSTTGTYGSVQAIFVEDHDDEYLPKGLGSADGVHLAALDVQVFRNST